jgi:hypothetical protein
MSFTEQELDAVISALENPNYKWRTVRGIGKESGLSPETVLEILSKRKDIIVQSSIPSMDGEDLYTTREHYREFASAGQKLLGALRNRVD